MRSITIECCCNWWCTHYVARSTSNKRVLKCKCMLLLSAQRGANPQPWGLSAAQWPACPGIGRRIGLAVWVILGLGGDLDDEDHNNVDDKEAAPPDRRWTGVSTRALNVVSARFPRGKAGSWCDRGVRPGR